MGGGTAHFGRRGRELPNLKKKMVKYFKTYAYMDLEAWCAQGTAKGGAKGPRGMVGPRGAAPLMKHW